MDVDAVQQSIASLGAKALDAEPDDKDALVGIGVELERLLGELDGQCSQAGQLLTQGLGVLQAVYQDAHANGPAAMGAIGHALAAASQLVAGTGPEGLFQQAMDEFSAAGQSSPTPAPMDRAPTAASTARLPDALEELSDLAARLMGLSPADWQELDAIKGRLVRLDAPALARQHAIVAAVAIENASAGGDDATSQLQTAIAEISEAMVAIEPAPQPLPAVQAQALAPASTPALSALAEFEDARLPLDADLDLLKEYIAESLDHIETAEASLLAMETNSTDPEHVNRVFRAFHTIKGTSGFLGLSAIGRVAHLAESLLDRAREGEIHITGGYADLALRSCDALKGMIAALDGVVGGAPLETPDGLAMLLTQLADPQAVGIGEDAGDDGLRVGEILVGRGQATPQDVEQLVANQSDKPIGEMLVESGVASAGEVAKALRTQKKMTAQADATVRVGTDRMDALINMVGELVIAHSMVAQNPAISSSASSGLGRSIAHTDKIIRELQDLTMALRMVPLKGAFQKMTRLVRDLAHKSGKNVQFVTEGEDTEIDRSMVESLNDPLVHMIRNACDHGIESSADRTAKGKSATGTVKLSAYQSAGNVIIELSDDGKGLDRERIVAKAIQRGLIGAGAEMSDSDVFNLIFLPGFSTAEKVTDVSGRGVGMDVVRKNIESLRGRVEISSRPGAGSTFKLCLPLTMAIADAMLLRVGSERYLLPTVSILQSFRPSAGSISTVTGRGEVVSLRGELMPVVRLHRLFDVPNAASDPYQGLLVVIQSGGKCALMVDELLGQRQVVIKSLGDTLGHIPGVSGGAILGDGRVGLILDAPGIAALARGGQELMSAAA